MPIQAIPHLALFRHESFHYSVDTGTEYITLCQLLVEKAILICQGTWRIVMGEGGGGPVDQPFI